MSEAVASPPQPTATDEELQDSLRIQLVDASDAVQANALDRAENYLSEHTTDRGVRGILGRVWQGNIARDYYRQREIQRGRREIVETGNIYSHTGAGQAEHDMAMAAVVERFTADYIHEGETNQNFEDAEHGQELMNQIQELVSSYARGDIEYDALVEERTRLLADFGHQVHQADRQRGLIYADNILEVAANARTAFEHGAGLERIDAAISGRLGEARTGVRTETRLEATDRAIDWLHRHHVTLVNEATLGLAVATGMTIAKFTTRKLAYAVAKWGTLGAGAGVIAGLREHLRVGQERTAHSRQMAEGGQIQAESSRRDQMEQTRYETIAAADLTDELLAAREAYESGDASALEALISAATAARARIEASDLRSIDLISYSGKASVEAERLALDIELARATVAIEAADNNNVDFNIGALQQSINELIVDDISAKDRAFSRLRRSRTIRMGLIGAATGMAAGLGIQEVHALIDGGLQGVTEGAAGSDRHSLLADIFRHHSASHSHPDDWQRQPFEGGHHFHDTAVDMPPGYHLVQVHQGEQFGWQIQDSDGHNVLDKLDWNKWQEMVGHDQNANHLHHIAEGHTGVGFDTQGNLDHDSRLALRELGWNLNQHHIQFHEPHLVSSHVERGPGEYLAHHGKDFTTVHRELWYDNNTPGVYDHNELKLWWGGSTGSGINSNGDYVFNVSHMSPDGSYHAGLSTDAQNLIHDGKMKIALSMTKGTQHQVFMVNVDHNGNAVIPHDSYIGRSLFEDQNGHAHFSGAYAEAVQVMGHNFSGGDNIRTLATVVGDNQPRAAADVVHHIVREAHTHYVTNIEAPTTGNTPIEIPPVLPIYGRRGLETLGRSESIFPYYGYSSYGPTGEYRRAPFAKQLEANPDSDIDANKSASLYLKSLRPGFKKTLSRLSKELGAQPKTENPKLVIMIPAAAHQEGKNIYHSLEQYTNQTANMDDFEIVVFANRPKGVKADLTIKEIERFQSAHPDVKVRLIQKELENDEANIGWIRKAMADTVISDLMERGIDLNKILLASNDADSEWIDPNYIKTILDKAEAEPNTDGFLGFLDWSQDAYRAHPEHLVDTRLMQMIEIYLRRYRGQLSSSGANFIYRPGIYTAVGGYLPNEPGNGLCEDVILGRMIKGVRSGAQTRRPIAFLGRSSQINTSSRRALDKLMRDGGATVEQWDNFGPNDELRTHQFDLKDFNFRDRRAVRQLVEDTQRRLNATVNAYRGSLADETVTSYKYGRLNLFHNETMRQLNRMMHVIGVQVKWQPDGSFVITDSRRMVANLKRWQAEHGGSPPLPWVRMEDGQVRLPRAVAAAERAVERSEARERRSNERLQEAIEKFRAGSRPRARA